ncbi:G-type lectin S-receptor-like serine/threonine-protein kinase At1g61370 [Rhodamnia argentea]|uniref:Receptor-like serine/threonine-protein kinase n=1 Tax=Rhodamnia argentea TaxID=178133 RepID=A0ABM3H4A1_9MYRT|nr:G-type lectin S-receptor-like serine/threonine-protein kinase At1g61370 [Rhodamnia argentea]
MNAYFYSSVILFLLRALQSRAVFNIIASEPLLQNQTLLSNSQIFVLGFFTPNGSKNQYAGIWYKNMTPSKVVWVANRDQPLANTDRSTSLTIGADGNLKLLDGQQSLVWSTNVTVNSNYSVATLSDYGNFVLQDANSNEIWGSFDEPTDTVVPNMKLGLNVKTGKKVYLVSWKSENDPSSGSFVLGITPETPPQAFAWNRSTPYWRGGQWDKSTFVGIPDMDSTYMSGFTLQQDAQQGTSYFILNNYNNSFFGYIFISSVNNYNNSFFGYIFISSDGSLKQVDWDDGTDKWLTNWKAPTSRCEIYGTCGPFSVCSSLKLPICSCLKGFKPRSKEEWNRETWTGGCIREAELQCQRNTSTSAPVTVKEDIFLKMSQMKLPDSSNYLSDMADAEECQSWCLSNCSCLAYSYVSTIGCMVWSEELIDIEQFTTAGEDLFIRLAHAGLSKQKKVIISLSTIFGIILCVAAIYGLCKWRANKRGMSKTMKTPALLYSGDMTDRSEEVPNAWEEQWRQDNASELTLFSFDSILLATNNFNISNKLGQGGFGPVYKGKLKDGKEIAVKRLSSSSSQGVEEFKNEILMISKLQHRNLVRLLGCCTEGEEKILVYEYLSNKSLDAFLFHSRKKAELSWDIRFHIVQGVARGLLYLHRDSCLRVIHRDLKVSNILLNEKMDPKISDFGLARMFEGTEVLVNTHRVVGTLGYMSPEYAMGGIFSEKSDVYSFGVLLLEIVSSKKNTSLDYHGQHLNLLIYAWQLWSGGRALDLMDEAIVDAFAPPEVMRCIHVGLLCVQDHAADRPNMSHVVLMLSGESDLPQPKQPTFTFRSLTTPEIQSSQQESRWSANAITTTVLEGR